MVTENKYGDIVLTGEGAVRVRRSLDYPDPETVARRRKFKRKRVKVYVTRFIYQMAVCLFM